MEGCTLNFTATYTVSCADSRSPSAIPNPFYLSPLDHLSSLAIPVGAVWVYESLPTCAIPVPIKVLEQAISGLLNYYPQLTGRLHIEPGNCTRAITRLGTGALLLEATCEAELSSFSDASTGEYSIASLPGSDVSLLAPWNPAVEAVQQNPLLTIQHTRFACGAVAIGVRLARIMSDTGGFIQLYRDLAEIYRAIEQKGTCFGTLEQPPQILPFMADEVTKIDLGVGRKATYLFPPSGYSVEPVLSETPMSQSGSTEPAIPQILTSPTAPIIGRELQFSSSELSTLKSNAQPPDGASWVSTFSALSAHI